jgi:hypothetical protein
VATLCDRGGRVSLPPPAARGRTCRPHAVLPQVASAAAWKWKVPGSSSSHHARSMKKADNVRRRYEDTVLFPCSQTCGRRSQPIRIHESAVDQTMGELNWDGHSCISARFRRPSLSGI